MEGYQTPNRSIAARLTSGGTKVRFSAKMVLGDGYQTPSRSVAESISLWGRPSSES